ncbi:MAG TPA: WYL domain-containing protein [Acidimicrobiales bacterium]|nr:WYL domain-containing protein [Acidimicrobiales bacterium]
MERVDRLERLTDLVLVLLREGRARSLREIADEVPGYPSAGEARRQAFERDKRTLRDEGIVVSTEPIDGSDQIGYRIKPEDFYLPDLGLTPEEQAALNLAVAAVHLGDPSGRDALWRLGSAPAPSPLTAADLPSLPALPVLFEALRAHATLTFSHRGLRRHVVPAVLRFRRGWWYLLGYDLDREAPRTFRVDRIEDRPKLGAPGSAVLPADFDLERPSSEAPWQIGDGDATDVEVLVDAVVVPRMLHEVGEGAVTEKRDDGSVVVRLEVSHTGALRSWLLEFGEHVEILSPPSAREEMIEWLAAVAAPGDWATG